MTLEDFFYQLRDAVRFYPAQDQKCLQPQTFRVLSFDADLSDQGGMGATVGVSQFRMEAIKSQRVEAEFAFDNKVVSSDLGYFFTAAVA